MRKYEHVQFLDLNGNGLETEVVVLKEERNGDKYFIKTDTLDEIDLDRLRGILAKRDAHFYPLWDLMSQTMLKNGMNALVYFNQLVKVKTAAGPIVRPGNPRGNVITIEGPKGAGQVTGRN